MGLANAASRARNYSQTVNQPQGGGNKKAGFPGLIGRDSWKSIFLGTSRSACGCTLQKLQLTFNPTVKQSRPPGSSVTTSYWRNGAHY
jgi:hypothetical protein